MAQVITPANVMTTASSFLLLATFHFSHFGFTEGAREPSCCGSDGLINSNIFWQCGELIGGSDGLPNSIKFWQCGQFTISPKACAGNSIDPSQSGQRVLM